MLIFTGTFGTTCHVHAGRTGQKARFQRPVEQDLLDVEETDIRQKPHTRKTCLAKPWRAACGGWRRRHAAGPSEVHGHAARPSVLTAQPARFGASGWVTGGASGGPHEGVDGSGRRRMWPSEPRGRHGGRNASHPGGVQRVAAGGEGEWRGHQHGRRPGESFARGLQRRLRRLPGLASGRPGTEPPLRQGRTCTPPGQRGPSDDAVTPLPGPPWRDAGDAEATRGRDARAGRGREAGGAGVPNTLGEQAREGTEGSQVFPRPVQSGGHSRAPPHWEGRPSPDPRPSHLSLAQRGRLLPRGALVTHSVSSAFPWPSHGGHEAWCWLCSQGTRRARERHTHPQVSPRGVRLQARAPAGAERRGHMHAMFRGGGGSCSLDQGGCREEVSLPFGDAAPGRGHLEDVGQRAPRFSLCQGDPCTSSGRLAGPAWAGLLGVARRGCQRVVAGRRMTNYLQPTSEQ